MIGSQTRCRSFSFSSMSSFSASWFAFSQSSVSYNASFIFFLSEADIFSPSFWLSAILLFIWWMYFSSWFIYSILSLIALSSFSYFSDSFIIFSIWSLLSLPLPFVIVIVSFLPVALSTALTVSIEFSSI